MQIKHFSLLSLVALVGASSSLCTESLCFTVPGSKSISPVPTTTLSKTVTTTVTTKSVSRQTVTITPAPVSSTTTVFATDTSTVTTVGNTDTFTTTTTVFITETTTEFSTETTTEISTWTIESPVATTTVPTTDGFVPLQSQIAAQGYTPAKRDDSPDLESRQADTVDESASSEALNFASYPAKVTCVVKVKVVETYTSVVTGRRTATTSLKPATSIVTSTSTVLTTTTVTQSSASVTVTDTFTSTISTSTSSTYTFTYTSTTVTTVAGPTATAYAVCETPQNYLRTVNGEGFNGFTPERDTTYAFNRSITDALACCNACQALGPLCAIGLSNGPSGCFFFIQYDAGAPVCDASLSAVSFTTSLTPLDPTTTIFNGNCGRFRYNR